MFVNMHVNMTVSVLTFVCQRWRVTKYFYLYFSTVEVYVFVHFHFQRVNYIREGNIVLFIPPHDICGYYSSF